MMAILIDPLEGIFCGRPYLIELIDIEIANNVKNVVISSVYKLLGEDFVPCRLQVFITDSASYCFKAGEDLREKKIPELIHITCIAHRLHRFADMVQQKFPLANELISNMKKMFLNSGRRKSINCFVRNSPPSMTNYNKIGNLVKSSEVLLTSLRRLQRIFKQS
uniref:Putative LOC100902024 [Metaseiulus occidentalis] n=1 Tax=Lepeophtheirus salmonis TaxID=72036 RepID=A0A0K2UN54_LEPSM